MSDGLTHYGVLGMQWGKRKAKAPVDTSDDHKLKKKLKKKRISEMSNAELKALTNRMQLEKQYSELRKTDNPSGKKIVQDILTNAAKQTATTYVNKYMNKALEAAIKKAIKS